MFPDLETWARHQPSRKVKPTKGAFLEANDDQDDDEEEEDSDEYRKPGRGEKKKKKVEIDIPTPDGHLPDGVDIDSVFREDRGDINVANLQANPFFWLWNAATTTFNKGYVLPMNNGRYKLIYFDGGCEGSKGKTLKWLQHTAGLGIAVFVPNLKEQAAARNATATLREGA